MAVSDAERLVQEATKRLDDALRAREQESRSREQTLLARVERLEHDWQAQTVEYGKAVDALLASHEALAGQVENVLGALRESQRAVELVRTAHKNAVALGGTGGGPEPKRPKP